MHIYLSTEIAATPQSQLSTPISYAREHMTDYWADSSAISPLPSITGSVGSFENFVPKTSLLLLADEVAIRNTQVDQAAFFFSQYVIFPISVIIIGEPVRLGDNVDAQIAKVQVGRGIPHDSSSPPVIAKLYNTGQIFLQDSIAKASSI
ncbi:hypothetical protein V1505DRAFT_421914 [Lipomyces doorenjongii]